MKKLFILIFTLLLFNCNNMTNKKYEIELEIYFIDGSTDIINNTVTTQYDDKSYNIYFDDGCIWLHNIGNIACNVKYYKILKYNKLQEDAKKYPYPYKDETKE